jgi:hypothetical protein
MIAPDEAEAWQSVARKPQHQLPVWLPHGKPSHRKPEAFRVTFRFEHATGE